MGKNMGRNREIISTSVFLLILLIAVNLEINNFSFIFNITFSLSSLFVLIIYKTWGFKRALISSLCLYLVGIFTDFNNVTNIFVILQVLFINGIRKYFNNLNIIYADMIFWAFVGIPLKFILYRYIGDKLQMDFLVFSMLKDALNAIINCIIADVITTYTPLRKINSSEKRLNIRFRDLLFHVLIGAIIAPLIFNFIENSWASYEQMITEIKADGEGIIENVNSSMLSTWGDKDQKVFILGRAYQVQQAKDIISSYDLSGTIQVDITNLDNNIITSNNEKVVQDTLLSWESITGSDGNYNSNFFEGNKKFILRGTILDGKANIYVSIPTLAYEGNLYDQNIGLIKAILIFSAIIIVGIMLINKVIFKSIEAIGRLTGAAFENIHDLNKINWPNSSFIEINALIDNFKIMLFQLEEKFEESTNLNRRLEAQKSQLIESKKKLHKQAYYDNLTGLPNRLSLNEQLKGLSLLINEDKIAIVFFDINRFKEINDTLGHDVGDELLQEVAKRLQKLITERILIYRIGGDEFVVIAKIKMQEEILVIGQRLNKLLSKKFYIRGKELDVKISIGASVYPDDDIEIDAIIKYADIAMYKSKQKGNCEIVVFNNQIKDEFMTKYTIEKGIVKGLAEGEFKLVFQPKINSYDSKVHTLEALIRWDNKELGLVAPNVFIPIAEETELIINIDKWVINEACSYVSYLNGEGNKDIQVSINISAKHFVHGDIVGDIKHGIESNKIDARQLKVEITEGVMISNIDLATDIIKQLNDIGVEISIDDFGTGFSSFSQLVNLPIDEIKIDKGFIDDILVNNKKALVVSLIVDLAHRLEINTVAEGVETLEQEDFLKGVGCDELQGYLFSKPLSATETLEFLNNSSEV